jgi:protoporphyrinogen oxidase
MAFDSCIKADKQQPIVIGAGPAGLTAAYELARNGVRPIVLEKSDKVGGLARTESRNGYRFDIGGHRFYSKVPEIEELWRQMLKDSFLKVPRLSRIYYRKRFFNYPLNFINTLANMGIYESFAVLLSYFKARVFPHSDESNFEQWVINRFGERLYRSFFKTYTEKVWGMACDKIQADWAAQRIKGLSLMTAVLNCLFGARKVKTLIDEFRYPSQGPGMMWQRFRQTIEEYGGTVHLNSEIVGIKLRNGKLMSVAARIDGKSVEMHGSHFISSMPITELVYRLDPPPPAEVLNAASKLLYRDFLIVVLVIDKKAVFPDNWLYIHEPDVKVGRIQNFKNWSREMVPDENKTCLGMEYFCNQDDELWKTADYELVRLAGSELARIGLVKEEEIIDGTVLRQPKAYPVYNLGYRECLLEIQDYLKSIDNLQTIGRNGMHRYNNQDHSMLTGLLAARNVMGENHNIWNVNTERSYQEDFELSDVE